jgi:hypothetical protein
MIFFALLLVMFAAVQSAAGQKGKRYIVMDFHAAGDGSTDDAKVTPAQTWSYSGNLASPSHC